MESKLVGFFIFEKNRGRLFEETDIYKWASYVERAKSIATTIGAFMFLELFDSGDFERNEMSCYNASDAGL